MSAVPDDGSDAGLQVGDVTELGEVLAIGRWDFRLFRLGDELVLSVLCGTVGLYEVDIALDADELARYLAQGVSGIRALIDDVRSRPSAYGHRQRRIR